MRRRPQRLLHCHLVRRRHAGRHAGPARVDRALEQRPPAASARSTGRGQQLPGPLGRRGGSEGQRPYPSHRGGGLHRSPPCRPAGRPGPVSYPAVAHTKPFPPVRTVRPTSTCTYRPTTRSRSNGDCSSTASPSCRPPTQACLDSSPRGDPPDQRQDAGAAPAPLGSGLILTARR